MTTLGILLASLLIGMRHALETDHLAAVASLATRSHSLAHTIRLGATWGIGHTITLFLFGSIVIWMDTLMPESLAHGLEFAVGIMLILLGADVLRRLHRDRVHIHIHRHADGTVHLHAHSHAPSEPHDPEAHHHEHPQGLPLRALLVGMVHGMAGSAALILLTLQTIRDPILGMLYMLVFGLGSVLGMALVSAVITLPLHLGSRHLTRLGSTLQLGIGLFTLGTGIRICREILLASSTSA